MTKRLARLRSDLDVMPSPVDAQPGIFMRDPFRYSEASIVVPPALVRGLRCFDGHSTAADLAAVFVRAGAAPAEAEAVVAQLDEALSGCGFLEDEAFRRLRETRQRAFRSATLRPPIHAGGGYPEEPGALGATLASWTATAPTAVSGGSPPRTAPGPHEPTSIRASRRLPPASAIAAPHASPHGGPATYAAAYGALTPEHADRTFVVLGTSHYGSPDSFGLTRKDFVTPLGRAVTDTAIVDGLIREAPQAFADEDYCHAVEHSIEFQVLFLQHRFGPGVRIVPILCGPFRFDPRGRARPEESPDLARAFGALGELHARRGRELCWVLGVDMAHVGRRYGDEVSVQAADPTMQAVEARDRQRLAAVAAGDAGGFWAGIHQNGDDDLKWCGSSPLYTFLRAVPGMRGRLLDYHQWNIDDASVVSFAALSFHERSAGASR
jgi:AmmeMemoRadiSam system protein B